LLDGLISASMEAMKALVLTAKAIALLLGAFAIFWFGYIGSPIMGTA
jgi:hypothetical protein